VTWLLSFLSCLAYFGGPVKDRNEIRQAFGAPSSQESAGRGTGLRPVVVSAPVGDEGAVRGTAN
jgi:hypothetical protein